MNNNIPSPGAVHSSQQTPHLGCNESTLLSSLKKRIAFCMQYFKKLHEGSTCNLPSLNEPLITLSQDSSPKLPCIDLAKNTLLGEAFVLGIPDSGVTKLIQELFFESQEAMDECLRREVRNPFDEAMNRVAVAIDLLNRFKNAELTGINLEAIHDSLPSSTNSENSNGFAVFQTASPSTTATTTTSTTTFTTLEKHDPSSAVEVTVVKEFSLPIGVSNKESHQVRCLELIIKIMREVKILLENPNNSLRSIYIIFSNDNTKILVGLDKKDRIFSGALPKKNFTVARYRAALREVFNTIEKIFAIPSSKNPAFKKLKPLKLKLGQKIIETRAYIHKRKVGKEYYQGFIKTLENILREMSTNLTISETSSQLSINHVIVEPPSSNSTFFLEPQKNKRKRTYETEITSPKKVQTQNPVSQNSPASSNPNDSPQAVTELKNRVSLEDKELIPDFQKELTQAAKILKEAKPTISKLKDTFVTITNKNNVYQVAIDSNKANFDSSPSAEVNFNKSRKYEKPLREVIEILLTKLQIDDSKEYQNETSKLIRIFCKKINVVKSKFATHYSAPKFDAVVIFFENYAKMLNDSGQDKFGYEELKKFPVF